MEMIEKKVALVTGVSSGIGRAMASLLSDRVGFEFAERCGSPVRRKDRCEMWDSSGSMFAMRSPYVLVCERCLIKPGESMRLSTMLVTR